MTSVERVLAYTKFPVYVTHGLSIFICPFLKVIHNLDYFTIESILLFLFLIADFLMSLIQGRHGILIFFLFTASNPERDVLFVVHELYLVRAFDVINHGLLNRWTDIFILPRPI